MHVRCDSKEAFVNPTTPPGMTAKQVNQTLNLNLGLPINPDNRFLRAILRFFMKTTMMWYEEYLLFPLFNSIPVAVRKWVRRFEAGTTIRFGFDSFHFVFAVNPRIQSIFGILLETTIWLVRH